MANKASAANVQADMQPPNFRAAVQHVRTTKAKKDKMSGLNGEIAAIYAKIEGFKVNRKGAKIFYALDNMEASERNDVLRSLNGMCDAAGWDEIDEDLVDKANDTVVHLRVGKQTDDFDELVDDDPLGVGDDLDEALAGEAFEMSEKELAKQEGRKNSARKTLDKATEPAAGTGADARAAMKSAAKEPYTGDNSDLAGTEPHGNA